MFVIIQELMVLGIFLIQTYFLEINRINSTTIIKYETIDK
jgi:hypothetical protein